MISNVSKQDIHFKDDILKRPSKIYINNSFFRTFSCQQCGWCCLPVSIEYYDFNIEKFKLEYPQFVEHLETVEVEANNIKKEIYVFNQEKLKNRKCVFLKNSSCDIHLINPLGCSFAPYIIRRDNKRNTGGFGLQHQSRKWIVREGTTAQCVITEFSMEQIQKGIHYLEELELLAKSFEISTWIPEAIEILKTIEEEPKDKILVGENDK